MLWLDIKTNIHKVKYLSNINFELTKTKKVIY